MAIDESQIAELSLWDGTKWTLKGWSRTQAWFKKIEDFWRQIEKADVATDPVNVRGHVLGRLNDLKTRIREAEAAGVPLRNFGPDLQNLINQAWGPCHPDSQIGQAMADLIEEFGAESALFAYAFSRNHAQPGHATNIEHFRGMIGASFPGWTGVAGSQRRLSNERSNFRASLDRISTSLDEAEESRKEHWSDLLEESGGRMIGWARRRSRAWRHTRQRWLSQRDERLGQLNALEQTYREKLSLMAPVEYWKEKARGHKTAEEWARGFVIAFFVVALPALIAMFGFSGWYLLNHVTSETPAGLYVVASAGLATTAGVLFWIGRLLTKLYLSQHHLRQDADERAVMTTTYLALTAEQAASDSDRTIILNALFRPTSDGIVKEEGGLDANLASVLSRFAARQ